MTRALAIGACVALCIQAAVVWRDGRTAQQARRRADAEFHFYRTSMIAAARIIGQVRGGRCVKFFPRDTAGPPARDSLRAPGR